MTTHAAPEVPSHPTPSAPERPHWAQRHPRDVEREAALGEATPPRRVISPSPFKLVSDYQPAGDQPQAIEALVAGLIDDERNQVLLGVTGSGKTYTMAQVIERVGRPALPA